MKSKTYTLHVKVHGNFYVPSCTTYVQVHGNFHVPSCTTRVKVPLHLPCPLLCLYLWPSSVVEYEKTIVLFVSCKAVLCLTLSTVYRAGS